MRFMILFCVLLGFSLSAAAQESVPAPSGEIAFASNRENDIYQIYVMNADGSNVQQLTHGETNSYQPVWSPDGQKIAFMQDTGERGRNAKLNALWVMDADGQNAVEIARDEEINFIGSLFGWLSWSPDSKRFIYRYHIPGEQRIEAIMVNVDGSELQVLALDVMEVSHVYFLTNDALLITDYEREGGNMLRYDLITGTLTPIADIGIPTRAALGIPLKPSPDGTQVAVIDGQALKLIDTGTGESRVTQESLAGLLPGEESLLVYLLRWSEDGSRIAGVMRAHIPSNPDLTPVPTTPPSRDLLFTVSTDGTEYAAFEVASETMTLSPDGEYVSYATRDEAGNLQIMIARADGQESPTLITSGAENLQPAWRPMP